MSPLYLSVIGGEMLETLYQRELIDRIKGLFPKGECDVLKNNSGYRQGIPDLSVYLPGWWAWLEVKPEEPTCAEDFEPNQEWYVAWANKVAFGATIYPGNEKEVLDALVRSYELSRYARAIPQREQIALDQL
jgi:hypothetical protein